MSGQYAYANPIQVVVGRQDVTALVQGGSWSNVDPGGFEACQLSLKSPIAAPRAGERITIRYGLEVVWDGRVNDPGNASRDRTQVEAIVGVGFGSMLSDNTMRETYVDRDMNSWIGANLARQQVVAAVGRSMAWVFNKGASGAQSLDFEGAVGSPRQAAHLFYDAVGANLGTIQYVVDATSAAGLPGTGTWTYELYAASADQGAFTSLDGAIRTSTFDGTLRTYTTGDRQGFLFYLDSNGSSQTPVAGTALRFTRLAVFGTHGLTRRSMGGIEPDGFYPVDIALHALDYFNGLDFGSFQIDRGQIDTDALAYVCPQAAYKEYTPIVKIIDDMMKLLGWHWGVWEPSGLHNTKPRLFLTKPPSTATASVSRGECEGFDAPRVRLDQLYNFVVVQYVAGSGEKGRVLTDDSAGPAGALLRQAQVDYRTLVIDAGTSTAAAATTLGRFALDLAFASARGAGSATLPGDVQTPGGRKPACLLKAGRDRIRITDLPDPGPLHETDTRRFDTFRVRRVETTIGQFGKLDTRVEFDGGADLMEVLNARTAAALVNLG